MWKGAIHTEFQYQTNPLDTILIIDDDEINRGILGNLFSPFYTILEAENGRSGLEILLGHQAELCAVLLDVVMPNMSGLEVLRHLNQDGISSQIPIFLITAEAHDAIMKEAYELGVMDVISKPIIPYVVERRVNSVVELFQARKRLENVAEQQQSKLLEQATQIVSLSMGIIESLSTAIEFRSGESGEHVRRIHDITRYMLLHTELGDGMSEETINDIALAAIMHDVGKIAIPDAILNKPGRLTPEEFEVMKTHTVQGAHLLEKIPQMREHKAYKYAYDITRHHHERWDGCGYPDHLKGMEIPVWTQIVSLADVYDALISKRVYKVAFSCNEALKVIQNGECGVFNPQLVDCFLTVEKDIRNLYYQR